MKGHLQYRVINRGRSKAGPYLAADYDKALKRCERLNQEHQATKKITRWFAGRGPWEIEARVVTEWTDVPTADTTRRALRGDIEELRRELRSKSALLAGYEVRG